MDYPLISMITKFLKTWYFYSMSKRCNTAFFVHTNYCKSIKKYCNTFVYRLNLVDCSVGRYHFFTSGVRYDKFRMIFGISQYLITQNYTKKIV